MSWYKNIPVHNIHPILYYAFWEKGWLPPPKEPASDDVDKEEFEDVRDLFADWLGKDLGQQLKQGLYREYIERTEDLPTIRGKIDMPGTIRNMVAQRRLITCEYDELSENTLSNQIIKTTAMLLLRESANVVKPPRKNVLRREMQYFSNVDEIRNPTTIPWSRVRYHRNNRGYHSLILLCELIIKDLLLTENGKHKLKRFFDDARMAWLYEKFLLGYYRKKFPQLRAYAKQIKWALEREDEDTQGEKIPAMLSDITLSREDKTLIIDAKWYKSPLQKARTVRRAHAEDIEDEVEENDDRDNQGKFRPYHLYQIYAYVKNKEAEFGEVPHTVSGMLLYALPKDVSPFNESYRIEGSDNKIAVRTLDLNQDFKGIRTQLDGIARDFFPEIFSEAKQQG